MHISASTLKEKFVNPNFVIKGDKILLRSNTKIRAFIGSVNGKYYYAFGKPSQSSYMAFFAPSKEQCLEELLKFYTLDKSILNKPMKEVK